MALSVTGLCGLHQDITVIKRTLKKIDLLHVPYGEKQQQS